MDVDDEKFGNLMYTRRQYIVPIWQREYSWGTLQWKELWNDIGRLYEEKIKTPHINHFMGSIVLKPKQLGGVEKYIIIDGQQRLATLMVIIALIRDKAKNDNPMLSKTIHNSYLLNTDIKTIDEQFKLQPSVNDNPAFEKIMNGDPDPQGLLAKAYKFFKHILENEKDEKGNNFDLKRLKEIVIDNLMFVEIILGDKDDPNRIFETLNSRGLELEQADLVRNYFMMKAKDERVAERLYRNTWLPMQKRLSTIENLTEYFRHYLAMIKHDRVKKDEIYRRLNERLKWSNETEIISELQTIAEYSKLYQRLLFPDKEPNPKICRDLKRLNTWKVTTAYPFLLKVYLAHLPEEDFCRILAIIESFVVRRHFCDVKTNSLNTIFTSLCSLDDRDLANSLEKKLVGYEWNYRWPDDAKFVESFQTFPIYKSSYSKCHLILSSLEESFGHPEKVNLEGLTIEHVMPETLTDWWKSHLGAEWKRIHSELLDTIGNLTFVGGPVNPALSNSPFPEKKKWFMKTKVDLSTHFQTTDKWTEKEIIERGRILSEMTRQIWKYPG